MTVTAETSHSVTQPQDPSPEGNPMRAARLPQLPLNRLLGDMKPEALPQSYALAQMQAGR